MDKVEGAAAVLGLCGARVADALPAYLAHGRGAVSEVRQDEQVARLPLDRARARDRAARAADHVEALGGGVLDARLDGVALVDPHEGGQQVRGRGWVGECQGGA